MTRSPVNSSNGRLHGVRAPGLPLRQRAVELDTAWQMDLPVHLALAPGDLERDGVVHVVANAIAVMNEWRERERGGTEFWRLHPKFDGERCSGFERAQRDILPLRVCAGKVDAQMVTNQ